MLCAPFKLEDRKWPHSAGKGRKLLCSGRRARRLFPLSTDVAPTGILSLGRSEGNFSVQNSSIVKKHSFEEAQGPGPSG